MFSQWENPHPDSGDGYPSIDSVSMQYLNRQRALQLIPLVVDDECHPETVDAFMDYIRRDDVVRKEYECHKIVKEIVQQKYQKEEAPDHLKHRIQLLLDREDRISGDGEQS